MDTKWQRNFLKAAAAQRKAAKCFTDTCLWVWIVYVMMSYLRALSAVWSHEVKHQLSVSACCGAGEHLERGWKPLGNEVNIGSFETLIVLHKMFAYILIFTVYTHRMGNKLLDGHRWVAPANCSSLGWVGFFGQLLSLMASGFTFVQPFSHQFLRSVKQYFFFF